MASLLTSLNASLVAGEAARLAQAQQARALDDVLTKQLRDATAQQNLPPNATITASYKFSVAGDGSLIPTETHITTQTDTDDSNESAPKKSALPAQSNQSLPATLSSITRPRPQLSPSDELAIFSGANTNETDTGSETTANISNSTVSAKLLSLAARAQQAAAALYARNGDAIYNVNPLVYEAA